MTVLAPTSNVCLRVGGPNGVQEEHRQFILVRAEKCPTSSGGGGFYIILHRSACHRAYKRVREGGAPRSQGVSGVCLTLLETSRGLGELSVRVSCVVSLLVVSFSFSPPLEWSLHAPFIALRRCRVTRCQYGVRSLLEKEPRGLGGALSGGDVVCTVEAWHWYIWHCCYMSRHVRHC
jgi:hypothetical protein